MQHEFDIRAERDDLAYRPRTAPRANLVLQIALGVWLGGMALSLTWFVLGLIGASFSFGLVSELLQGIRLG